jgi:hypothetical protein
VDLHDGGQSCGCQETEAERATRLESWQEKRTARSEAFADKGHVREYRVTIAADDDPSSDPWAAEPTEPFIDVAAGDESELDEGGSFSPAGALRVAVRAVRTALARNACDHRRVEAEPYCPSCGVRLEESDAWRWAGAVDNDPS